MYSTTTMNLISVANHHKYLNKYVLCLVFFPLPFSHTFYSQANIAVAHPRSPLSSNIAILVMVHMDPISQQFITKKRICDVEEE